MINYQDLQNVITKLHKEIQKWITLAQVQKAAIKLGIYHNRQIQFSHQFDKINFYDFIIYEEANDNNRVIDKFYNEYIPKIELEKEVIEMMKYSYTSLFLIKKIDLSKNKIFVVDLINNKELITIIDSKIINNCNPKCILFTRILETSENYFTSGMYLLFKGRYKKQLLKEWKKSSILESDETHRFINLFHLHRKKHK